MADVHDETYGCSYEQKKLQSSSFVQHVMSVVELTIGLLFFRLTWKDRGVLVCATEVQVRPVYSRIPTADKQIILLAWSLKSAVLFEKSGGRSPDILAKHCIDVNGIRKPSQTFAI